MEITIDGVEYETIRELIQSECRGCVFDSSSIEGCSEASSQYPCAYHGIIWQRKATGQTPPKAPPKAPPEPIAVAPVDQKPGTKYDDEKIQYTLIPPFALQEAARNLTVGLRKYKERDNWKKVENAEQRYMDAIYRHIEAVRRGEIYDTESGAEDMPHLAAVVVNAMFVLEFMLDPKLKKAK